MLYPNNFTAVQAVHALEFENRNKSGPYQMLRKGNFRYGMNGQKQKNRLRGFHVLSCQGSNLNSSDPESDVLPITPQDSF